MGSFYKQSVVFLSFINTRFTGISHSFNNADEPWSEIYLNLWQNSNKSLLDCFKSQRQSLMQTYSIIKSHLELVQVCYTYEIKSLPCIFMAIDLSVQYLRVLYWGLLIKDSLRPGFSKAKHIPFGMIPWAGKRTACVWGQETVWNKIHFRKLHSPPCKKTFCVLQILIWGYIQML